MAKEVQVKKGSEINAPSGAQTEGMIRMNAIVDLSDQICGTGEFLHQRQCLNTSEAVNKVPDTFLPIIMSYSMLRPSQDEAFVVQCSLKLIRRTCICRHPHIHLSL